MSRKQKRDVFAHIAAATGGASRDAALVAPEPPPLPGRVLSGGEYDVPYAGPGVNFYRLPFEVPQPRLWDPESPWLYQIQVRVTDKDACASDVATRQFGMRSFRMDETSEPKGRFTLNGREIRLRGANTMGHLQQCVMRKDWDQLRDDILLAKICHMNFLRLTQRPVQPEIYEFCDRLGLMTQTDLPLFAFLRKSRFCEAVKQAHEMERLVRSHPCNIVVTYINEPMAVPADKSQRHLVRSELEGFFAAADRAVRLANPDRVIKPVDGDYDPPAPGLPDNHCYCGWYNGHGVDLGRLHKGYWQKVKPGWFYGCGEFGAEGLDPVEVMRRHYPAEWLPQAPEEEKDWTPDRIPQAQTGRFHYFWFDTQHTLADWVAAGQAHQAWVTRLMTEAFRRDSRMNSFAIHLFIGAFPSGWMKAVMDVERNPKPAYFAYREALTPLMCNLRTDRFAFFTGETVDLEAWVCNDRPGAPDDLFLHYQVEMNGEIISAGRAPAEVPVCGSVCQGLIRFQAPHTTNRTRVTVRLGLLAPDRRVLHDTAVDLDVFPRPAITAGKPRTLILGAKNGKAATLASELDLPFGFTGRIPAGGLILIDDFAGFRRRRNAVTEAVRRGATAVFLELPPGAWDICDTPVQVTACGMGPRHFVSRATGHPLVADFAPADFRFWYDPVAGYVTPLLQSVFTAAGWRPILASGNGDWRGEWRPALAAAERPFGAGRFRICQVALAGRTSTNPPAAIFARRLLGSGS